LPRTLAFPESSETSPRSDLMSVLFPDPLGPSKPVTPELIESDTPSNAVFLPYALVAFVNSIMHVILELSIEGRSLLQEYENALFV
jgi:hypothetical protein